MFFKFWARSRKRPDTLDERGNGFLRTIPESSPESAGVSIRLATCSWTPEEAGSGVAFMSSETAFNRRGGATGMKTGSGCGCGCGCGGVDANRFKLILRGVLLSGGLLVGTGGSVTSGGGADESVTTGGGSTAAGAAAVGSAGITGASAAQIFKERRAKTLSSSDGSSGARLLLIRNLTSGEVSLPLPLDRRSESGVTSAPVSILSRSLPSLGFHGRADNLAISWCAGSAGTPDVCHGFRIRSLPSGIRTGLIGDSGDGFLAPDTSGAGGGSLMQRRNFGASGGFWTRTDMENMGASGDLFSQDIRWITGSGWSLVNWISVNSGTSGLVERVDASSVDAGSFSQPLNFN